MDISFRSEEQALTSPKESNMVPSFYCEPVQRKPDKLGLIDSLPSFGF